MKCLIIALLLVSFQIAQASDFKKVLETIGNEHARVKSAQFAALAQKVAQLPNKLAWTPSLTAEGRHPIREWGTNTGEAAYLSARLNVFKFGGQGSQFREAQKSEAQADVKTQLARIDVEDQAAQVIFSWIDLQGRLDSQRALYNGKRELVRVAQDRFKRGQLPAQEVEKVRLDASNAEVQIRQAEVDLLNLKSELDSYLPGASELKDWPWQSIATTNIAIQKKIKKTHERLQFQNLKLESEIYGHRSWQRTTNWLPQLDITSTWATAETSPVKNGEWNALMVLTVPLWDRGQALADRRANIALESAAQNDLRDYQNQSEAKLRTLNERREKLQQNVLAAIQASEKAKNIAVDSLRRFQLGRSSVNDLLLDQARVYDAEILAQQASKQFHLILLEICLAADERPSNCYK